MDIIQSVDIAIFKWIHFYIKNDFFDILLPYLRNKLTWIPLYVYFLYHLYKVENKNYFKLIISALILVILSDFLCAKVLKEIVERQRPCHLFINEIWFSNFNLCSSTYSFPSCHALNHMVIASFLFPYFKNMGKYLLILWVFFIGFSQVYIGVHFPSDILGGIIIGAMISIIFTKLIQKIFHF